ncbi:hypothetical protein Syun_019388 [Stephania yunnanensis]|uniref:Uncharacterized protein n=1 Tax=Stephania yunnanensis TaxID=152371 RepID=A0AAP0IU25_9MAGN
MDCKLDNNIKPKQAGNEPEEKITKQEVDQPKSSLWDCGSSLYDSFEKKSFERQLNSAIASRSFSMPRLPPTSSMLPPPQPTKKPAASKISRSLNKFLRSVFRPKSSSGINYGGKEYAVDALPYLVQDQFGSLSAIPEMQEIGLDNIGWLPDRGSLVGRSASERFSATSIGISCA